MKKLLSFLIQSILLVSPAYAITQTPAKDISANVSAFVNCLDSGDTNVQLSLNSIDACLGMVVSSQWITSGSNIYNGNAGNVGIGSANPGKALDVQGSIRASTDILIGTNSVCQSNGTNCLSGTFSGLANPTASLGLTAINGSATTAMRSDGAPALDQSIVPTWTGLHTFNKSGTSLVTTANVGIASSSPGTALDVQGSIRTSTNDNTLGNVGIGTVGNTNAKLDIFATSGDANIRLQSGGTVTVPSVNFYNPGGTKVATVEYRNSGVSPASVMRLGGIDSGSTVQLISNNTAAIYLDANSNIGLGSATPGSVLDINRNTRFVGTNYLTFGNDGLAQILASANTTPDIRFLTNATEVMRITNGGNVGIGTVTASPAILSVKGDIFAYPQQGMNTIIRGASANAYSIMNVDSSCCSPSRGMGINFSTPGNIPQWDFNRITTLTLQTTPTLIQNIMSVVGDGNIGIGTTIPQGALAVMSGNVGIGTWKPRAILEVNGQELITSTNTLKFGATSAATIGSDADTTAGNLQLRAATTGEIETLSVLRIKNAGSTFFPIIYTGAGPSLNIELEGSGNSGIVFSQSALTLNLASQYRLVADGGITTAGNIGIASTAPGSKLDVQGTARIIGGELILSSGQPIDFNGAASTSSQPYLFSTGAATNMELNVGNVSGTAKAFEIRVTSSQTRVLDILANGNVGIGTVAPANLLAVGTGSPFQVASTGAIATVGVSNITNAITNNNSYTQSGTSANVFTGTTSFANAQGVGIGDASPDANLEIVQDAGTFTNIIAASSTAAADGDIFIVSRNKSVGVNDTSPDFPLEIVSIPGSFSNTFGISSTGTGDGDFLEMDNTGNLGLHDQTPDATLEVVKISSNPVLMVSSAAANNGDYVMVNSSGNVGIGSLTPGAILDVAGKSRITAGGHSVSTGTAPTVANNDCGTTAQGTVTAKSTDNSGTMTVGTLAVTSCAMTFASAWVNAPNCVVIDDTNVLSVKASTTTTKLTVTATTSMSGDVISYICQGNE